MSPTPPSRSPDPRSAPPERVGLFGGSFDPIHAGHLHAARAARTAFGLDRVVFVPANQSPYKPTRRLAPGPDRLEMLRLALRGEPGFEVSDLELERQGPSYTIDTVRALRGSLGLAADASIHLILGSDVLDGLAGWREARALLEAVQPVVVHRAGPMGAADPGDESLEIVNWPLGLKTNSGGPSGNQTCGMTGATTTSKISSLISAFLTSVV
jgi:nicotinate (nicotinamide) nucleotide adenylyltransferase